MACPVKMVHPISQKTLLSKVIFARPVLGSRDTGGRAVSGLCRAQCPVADADTPKNSMPLCSFSYSSCLFFVTSPVNCGHWWFCLYSRSFPEFQSCISDVIFSFSSWCFSSIPNVTCSWLTPLSFPSACFSFPGSSKCYHLSLILQILKSSTENRVCYFPTLGRGLKEYFDIYGLIFAFFFISTLHFHFPMPNLTSIWSVWLLFFPLLHS